MLLHPRHNPKPATASRTTIHALLQTCHKPCGDSAEDCGASIKTCVGLPVPVKAREVGRNSGNGWLLPYLIFLPGLISWHEAAETCTHYFSGASPSSPISRAYPSRG